MSRSRSSRSNSKDDYYTLPPAPDQSSPIKQKKVKASPNEEIKEKGRSVLSPLNKAAKKASKKMSQSFKRLMGDLFDEKKRPLLSGKSRSHKGGKKRKTMKKRR